MPETGDHNVGPEWQSRLPAAVGLFRGLFGYYLLALMTTAHVYFLLELLRPVGPPIAFHVHVISWALPVSCAVGALVLEYLTWRKTRRETLGLSLAMRHRWRDHLPFLVGLAMFGFWAGGYFLVGALSAHESFHTMATSLDARFPYVPQAVFIYLTVYPAALLPFVWEESLSRALRSAGAMFVTLVVAYTIMYLYPVMLPHPKPSGPMLTRFALSLLHSADPAWNCFPSSHCAVVLSAGLSLWHQGKVRGSYGIGLALAIGLSTILTKQHYVADAAAGFLLAWAVHCVFFRTRAARRISEHLEERAMFWADRLSANQQVS